MRLRNVRGSEERIAENEYVVQEPQECRGKWRQVFGNDHPVHIEIGMGKGRFLMELAGCHPELNYIGIEKYSSVIVRALEKQEEQRLNNIRFLCFDAQNICDIFADGEVDKIYLNFSDPWPKDRHARRRLTSKEYLARYDQILQKDGVVEFKTDNRGLFDFSMEQYPLAGWELVASSYDLHHDEAMMQGNVMTEYEEKFSSMGNPIHKMIIRREP